MAERVWTDEQRKAIYAQSGTLLVSAAAGSGKTSVLVERIARKLTDPVNKCAPDELLVVTFTNAAASEMRSRIFERIAEKAANEPERRREYTVMRSRLDGMKVCTMDSFCMNFVRENFHECGIESDFRMLDGGESDVLKKSTAAEVIERFYGEDGGCFFDLARLFEKGRTDAAFIDSIIKLSDFSMSEPEPEKWLVGIADNFKKSDPRESVFGKIIAEDIKEGLEYCLELISCALNDAEYAEELYAKIGPVLENDKNGIHCLCKSFDSLSWDGLLEAVEAALGSMKAKKLYAPKDFTDEPHKLAAAEKRSEVKTLLEDIIKKMSANTAENGEDVDVLAPLANEMIKTVLAFNRTLLERKREMNAFDFSDILHFTLSLLLDPGSTDGRTALAREMADGFNEILIDEYQDTNRAQESLFGALSKNGKNMFMVGDVKQSIYRFRLASPELFIEKCDAYPYYDGKSEKSKIILGSNFRSRKGVTDAVNFIFSSVMSRQCGEIDYNDDEMLRAEGDFPHDDRPSFELDVLADSECSGFEAEARYTAALIKRELESGAVVAVKDGVRKAVPGDFCILLRSAKGISDIFSKALASEGLSVSVDSKNGFFESAEIRIVLAFLRVIDDPLRDVDLLGIMMSPIFGFSADEAARLRIGRKNVSLFAAVRMSADNGDEKCRMMLETVEYYKKLAATLNAGDLISEMLSDTAFLSVCGCMKGGELRKSNVRRLLEYAESAPENIRTLSGFVRYIDALIENGSELEGASVSADPSSVSIMTMHRSKGLEFPFVIIAGTIKKNNRNDMSSQLLISHKNGIGLKRREPENIKSYDTLSSSAIKIELSRAAMSEELRIFYVALTRARERLFIVMSPEKAEEKLDKLRRILPDGDTVPPYFVRRTNAPFEWLLASLLHHPDARALGSADHGTVADTRAVIRLIDKLPELHSFDAGEKKKAAADDGIVRRIAERASFTYRYAPVASSLSKHTASSVNEEKFDPEYFARMMPAFMSASSLTPADRGTATHKFLQYCDFGVCREDPRGERERLVDSCRITRAEADCVDMEAVKVFVNSDIMKRCENAQAVYREKQFTLAKSVCDMDKNVPDEFRDEKTVVIGKIDMVFIENGEAVIVDYKTDNIRDIGVLRERYSEQLKLYSEAVERIMEVRVKQCILYSLKLKKYSEI